MQVIKYSQQMFILAADGESQGIFFFAAVYVFLILIYSLVFQVKVSLWPHVIGELLNEQIAEFGFGSSQATSDYKVSITYKYNVGGKEYVGTRLSPWVLITDRNAIFFLKKQLGSVLRKGDGKVAVYYNPKAPQKSFLVKPGLVGKAVTVALSITPLLLYFFKY